MSAPTWWVIIFRPGQDEPVFHTPTYGVYNPQRTVCGRPIESMLPWFPRKHAVKIGRPCKDCER